MRACKRGSTRLRGFHLRHYDYDDEAGEFSAWIYRNQYVIGRATCDVGLGFVVAILPDRQPEWHALLAFLHDHPTYVDQHGAAVHDKPEEDALYLLQTISRAESSVVDSESTGSGFLASYWITDPYEHRLWFAATVVYLGNSRRVNMRQAPAHLFRILVLGRDKPSVPPAIAGGAALMAAERFLTALSEITDAAQQQRCALAPPYGCLP